MKENERIKMKEKIEKWNHYIMNHSNVIKNLTKSSLIKYEKGTTTEQQQKRRENKITKWISSSSLIVQFSLHKIENRIEREKRDTQK